MFIVILMMGKTVTASVLERPIGIVEDEDYCDLVSKRDFPEIFSKGRAIEVLADIFTKSGLYDDFSERKG